MFLTTYKDTANRSSDLLVDTLPEALEKLIDDVEEGMDRNEDISAGIYDLSKPDGERLVVDYFSSNFGDSYTVLRPTKNLSTEALEAEGIKYEIGEWDVVLKQWHYEA